MKTFYAIAPDGEMKRFECNILRGMNLVASKDTLSGSSELVANHDPQDDHQDLALGTLFSISTLQMQLKRITQPFTLCFAMIP